MKIVTGNLLDGSYPYIAHQCYAIAGKGGGGLAHAVFAKHPAANAYTGVKHDAGSIFLERPVINMFSQKYPGYANDSDDTPEMRHTWFGQSLQKIGMLYDVGVTSVAFPYMIGCDMAGGYWLEYEDILIRFDNWTKQEITLVKLARN